MLSQIGAGAVILMGDAATPLGTWNGGTAGNANLDNVTEYFSNFNVSTTQGTVDVTKLDADLDAYFRTHIAGLRGATISANFGDDEAGTMVRRIFAIQGGNNHTPTGGSTTSRGGRGKVDIIIRPFGTGSGKVEYRCTIIPTDVSPGAEVEGEVGGSFSATVDGEIVIDTQS